MSKNIINMGKKKTREEFIRDATAIHGDKYDYSEVVYVKDSDKVFITCNKLKHRFEQTPNSHLSGRGCRKCGSKKTGICNSLTYFDFLNKSILKHKDKYDYSSVVFINKFTKVKISCKTHGEINITPEVHLRTCGCSECGEIVRRNNLKKDHSIQLQKFIDKHGDRYDYSKTLYTDSKTKITVTCRIHGDFTKDVNNFLKGSGCPSCGNALKSQSRIMTNDQFIEKANKIHSNFYDYSQTIYVKSNSEVEIECKIDNHGIFKQKPNIHLSGSGCKKCGDLRVLESNTGWKYSDWIKGAEKSKNFDSFKVYLIKCWNDEEEFYKIGKTFTTIKNRFPNKSVIPYNYKIIKCFVFDDGRKASKKEEDLKIENREYKYVPKLKFSGNQECYNRKLPIKQIT
jgi:hypothetical protein